MLPLLASLLAQDTSLSSQGDQGLEAVLYAHSSDVSECYAQLSDPPTSGTLTLYAVVQDGLLMHLAVIGNTVGPELQECVLARAGWWQFPAVSGELTHAYHLVGGVVEDSVESFLAKYSRDVRDCNEAQQQQSSGSLVLELSIAQGGVEAVRVADSSAQSPELRSCVLTMARGWHFPYELRTQVSYTFELSPQDLEAQERALAHAAYGEFRVALPSQATPWSVERETDRAAVGRAALHNIDPIQRCYQIALATDPDLQGRVEVLFVVRRGRVVRSELFLSTVDTPELERCIVDAVRRWEMPSVQGRVVYPFILGPAEEPA